MVDTLLDEGFKVITVLDISETALATSKARLRARGAHIQWVVADITTWEPSQTYDVWHDRAVLHFLTDPKDRAAYAERVLPSHRTCDASPSSPHVRRRDVCPRAFREHCVVAFVQVGGVESLQCPCAKGRRFVRSVQRQRNPVSAPTSATKSVIRVISDVYQVLPV